MKRYSILALLLCLWCYNAIAQAPYTAPPVTTGLRLHLVAINDASNYSAGSPAVWRDRSGAGNDVFSTGTSSTTFATNVAGSGFDGINFNGSALMESAGGMLDFENDEATIFVVRIAPNESTGATLISIGEGNTSFNNEFLLMDGDAYHHTSSGNWNQKDHQCYGDLPTDRPVVLATTLGRLTTDIEYYVNNDISTNAIATTGSPSNYTSVGRGIHVGARRNGTVREYLTGDIMEILAFDHVLSPTEVNDVNVWLQCKYQVNYTACNIIPECDDTTTSDCSDVCFWKVEGNNILNGNNKFGTRTDDDILIISNENSVVTPRGIITGGNGSTGGYFGWNTTSPTAKLHVDCINSHEDFSGMSDIRFENLEHGEGKILVIDDNGYVFNSDMDMNGGGVQNNCLTTNMVPKVSNSNGDLDCSMIYDDGTSVGIGPSTGSASNNFNYTWSGGLSGTTMPPTSGTVRLDVEGVTRALAYIATSDARAKTDIKTITNATEIISMLQGKTYNWTEEVLAQTSADGGRQYGFIAQEVAEVMPEAVVVDEQGRYGINYNMLIPVLTEGIKSMYAEQQKTAELIKVLSERIEALEKNTTKTDVITPESNRSMLFQNAPNPFDSETMIEYYVHKMEHNAYIVVVDESGRELVKQSIRETGKGKVVVNGSQLVPGVYIYSLVVDGVHVDSKRMSLSK